MKPKHIKMYMEIAECLARASVGERLKVGAVLVRGNNILSTGYNALPEHIEGPLEDKDGNTRPEVRHAEKNALMALTKSNESSVDATLFTTHSCCLLCAVDIVDAGVKKVYFREQYRDNSGIDYLRSNGIHVEQI